MQEYLLTGYRCDGQTAWCSCYSEVSGRAAAAVLLYSSVTLILFLVQRFSCHLLVSLFYLIGVNP